MMFVRVKRKNYTIFLHVEPSDNFATVKTKCGEVFGVPPSYVGLFTENEVELMDLSTVSDLEIANDSVLYMVMKKDGGETFEKIDVEKFSPPGDEARS
mmetsp:Transcript_21447/g.25354  ORF Transcript_21447/g.25354 Transcript_21447/m.25354 type:complete len:98 (-) Transcript_21447:244-537(-)